MSETWTRITPPKTEEKNEKLKAQADSAFWRAEYMEMITERDAARKQLKAALRHIDDLENKNSILKVKVHLLQKQLGDEVGELKDERRALADKVVGLEIENDKLRAGGKR